MSELAVATKIYDKILTLFPEAETFLEEKELAYILMGDRARWLENIPNCSNERNFVGRVKVFAD